MITVVIPVRNEAERITDLLTSLRSMHPEVELIVVDSGSTDDGIERARPLCRVVTNEVPGRGAGLDAGVRAASGEHIVFLHCDTRVPDRGFDAVQAALRQRDVVGGWFDRRLDASELRFRLVDLGANGFSRVFTVATGDQALFCRRSAYEAVDPLSNHPLFEDMELCRRLKRVGRLVRIPDPVVVSPRRFCRLGVVRTVARNLKLTWAHFHGEDPAALYRRYYR